MSMFRSLADSAASITLFKVSMNMLASLKKHSVVSSSGVKKEKGWFDSILGNRQDASSGRYRYQINVVEDTLPTKEQYNLIKSYARTTPFSHDAFTQAFPRAMDPTNKDVQSLFVRPLVVDWEHKLLASNETHLSKLLSEAYGINI
ncbi:hypothetical protein FOA43_004082 [Brettanomyces nanus]|uniref:Uncharacterized protein n=1 Tax=Eeniella nana TaxID=13502 RepID=A0A875S6W3_EENNA|nr:uncharacterized protein FOA43_004082 [Brettanomyces nanus]QPG76688.1 hypothetical protein FOA43_004082 [Brettanomyces nanus]